MDPLKLTLSATATASLDSRTITGTITVFSKHSSSQGIKLMPGSLTPRTPHKRVKMLRDHNQSDPLGYMIDYQPGNASTKATFYVPEGAEGDRALQEADNGLRDGFSVGFIANKYEFDDDFNLIVHEAELYEVSVCAVPDFQDAQVEAVALSAARNKGKRMTPEEIAQLQAEATAANNALAAATGNTPEAPAPAAAQGAPAPAAVQGTPAPAAGVQGQQLQAGGFPQAGNSFTAPRPQSLRAVALKVAAAFATEDPVQIRLALADVVPADDAGQAFLSDRNGWIGEVWNAANTDRPWIDAFGTPAQLTSMKIKGYRWSVRPKPAKYAGNKAEVPTNTPKTEPWESEAGRWAGGWDIDRIYFDFGDAAFLESFWRAAMAEYQQDSNKDIGTQVRAAATVKPNSPTVLAGIKDTARDLRSIGAKASTIFLANDIFDEYGDLTQAEVPHWLANVVGGFDISEGTATVGPLTIDANPDLAPGEIVGIDKRAGQVREKTPIKLQAHDIAKGGIDLGFFSYGGLAVYDPRAIIKRSVVAPAPPAG